MPQTVSREAPAIHRVGFLSPAHGFSALTESFRTSRPVELARFHLVVNLRVARTMGLPVLAAVVSRADKVIR